MNKPFLTVFTPAYNRAYTLPRTFDSMKQQKNTDFVWLIVDDGSSDNTAELVKQWQAEENGFEIRYIYKENGGMHTAHNAAYELIDTELNTCVDSDDALTPNAIAQIRSHEKSIQGQAAFAGLAFLRGEFSGRMIGTTFSGEFCDCTTLEREAHHITGDKAEVFYTQVLRRYPFPEFEGENFLSEAVVWDRIAHDSLKLRWINEAIYLCEYQPGGLTDRWNRLLYDNPRGHALWIRQKMDFLSCTGYERFYLVYSYYYTMNLTADFSMNSTLTVQ